MVAPIGDLGGLALLAAGAFGVKYAHEITAFDEQMDATGGRRSGPVEPADWNVALTEMFSAVAAGAGGIIARLALLD